jgi:hypothetical protein
MFKDIKGNDAVMYDVPTYVDHQRKHQNITRDGEMEKYFE